jgi:hypothetical protein
MNAFTSLFKSNFNKCVAGYHFINDDPINETIWEAINCQILKASNCTVYNSSSGSHSSGKDIDCLLGGLSNKSTKFIKKNQLSISSYRLTTVCSEQNTGNIESIIAEINKRKNFNYYSIIVRTELPNEFIYKWYLFPSNHLLLDPNSYNWEPMYGQKGKKIGIQIGWKTNTINGSKMCITFSMSSQLWIHLNITPELETYCIAESTVSNKKTLDYLQIYDIYCK